MLLLRDASQVPTQRSCSIELEVYYFDAMFAIVTKEAQQHRQQHAKHWSHSTRAAM
jgi:hypothetical protein